VEAGHARAEGADAGEDEFIGVGEGGRVVNEGGGDGEMLECFLDGA
jgi:hypothetical protein